jgi:hypothetical protein
LHSVSRVIEDQAFQVAFWGLACPAPHTFGSQPLGQSVLSLVFEEGRGRLRAGEVADPAFE